MGFVGRFPTEERRAMKQTAAQNDATARTARLYRMVMPDLRGYGDSSHAVGDTEHAHYSKRAMAQEVVGLLDALGVGEFLLCGRDRGGRGAHRSGWDLGPRDR